jgi:carboxypeptidase Taq
MTVSRLDTLFDELKGGLLPLIQRIKSSSNRPDRSFLEGMLFAVDQQVRLNHRIAKELGFDVVCLFACNVYWH